MAGRVHDQGLRLVVQVEPARADVPVPGEAGLESDDGCATRVRVHDPGRVLVVQTEPGRAGETVP